MSKFAELLARKTQIKNCLAEGRYSKKSEESMKAELQQLSLEIDSWLRRRSAF